VDRISALRNVEDALRAFEEGRADLAATEERVATILRTYATEFEADDDALAAYRVRVPGGDGDAALGDEEDRDGDGDGNARPSTVDPAETVVVAPSRAAARERLADLLGVPRDAAVEVERLG
jgi:hypothetical protein